MDPVTSPSPVPVVRRRVAVLTHSHREQAISAAKQFIAGMADHNIICVLPAKDLEIMGDLGGAPVEQLADEHNGASCELVVIFGGDGTILRGAEWALLADIPLLGVNLGHVGFLAEAEATEIDETVKHVVAREYRVEERLTVDVEILDEDGQVVWSTFAVNEVSVEKGARERMIEVVVKVNDRSLSRWACDGVLVATPTGSTAYSFSAGGPVVWPGVEAMLMVPLSAHALFNRPMVFPPKTTLEVELLPTVPKTEGIIWCDGRRSSPVWGGQTVRATAGQHRLLLARLGHSSFTDRLVRKFGLQVEGLRGVGEKRLAQPDGDAQ
ncbi:NAD kinase [Enemella sp. A6]|uniref:NAD kinase n=1 Tax=Enemella sp. A6 TaxID=3440152 RepID=UPI003EB8FA08